MTGNTVALETIAVEKVMINNFVHHEITILPVESLVPHPDNRPLGIEQEKVDQLADGIRQFGFYSSQPLVVRTKGECYEIIKGEHRWRACQQLGYTEVPCTIVEYSDDAALVQLIAGNTQSENCPLDVGAAAFKYCKKGVNRHSENERSLSEFAKSVGYSKSAISMYVDAYGVVSDWARVQPAELYENARVQLKRLTSSIYEISTAPKDARNVLLDLLLEKEWTRQDIRKKVKRAHEFEVPLQWQTVFLPLSQIIYRSLDTDEFSPKTVNKLIEAVEAIESRIATYKTRVSEFLWEFRVWLTAHTGADSWDTRKIEQYGRELQARVEAAEREEQERFLLGDWRDCLDKLQDESVALVLTDPPYGMDYQSDYRLDRDQDRKHETIEGDASTVNAVQGITDCLTAMHPKLKADAHIFCFCHWSNEADIRGAVESAGYKVRGSLIWVKNNTGMGDPTTTFAPKHERIIHAVKGSPVLFSRSADVLLADRCNSERHPTEKPISLLKQLIEVTSTKDELVVDPFAGVASTLVAAKELGRAFFGCEINEAYFNKGSERL